MTAQFNPTDHMTKLKGKDYLEVKWRVLWFRTKHPKGNIDTDVQVLSDSVAIVKAVIYDDDGTRLASGMATVRSADNARMSWAGRDVEKAETAAIGRALAHAGFGTQFTGEDEGDFLADSSVEPSNVTDMPQEQNGTQDTGVDVTQWQNQIKALVQPLYVGSDGKLNPFHMDGSIKKALEEGVIGTHLTAYVAAAYLLVHRAEADYGLDTEAVQAILGGKVSDTVQNSKDSFASAWSVIRASATQKVEAS